MNYRYKCIIEYDGSFFSGWQYQEKLPSVQGVLAQAAYNLTQQKVIFHGAGRTDRGVHARGQVAHVDFVHKWPEETLCKGINFYLKEKSVRVLSAQAVPPSFDARFSAKSRRYVYIILNRPVSSVLDSKRCWWVYKHIDVEKMHKAALYFQGKHDFAHFRHQHCQSASSVKTLDILKILRTDSYIIITAQARSFLHRQVRMMVGALVCVGTGRWVYDDIKDRLNLCPVNTPAAMTAPACGLFLDYVSYDEE
jgi:tRNA pseudouridine38-40 synthase